MLRRRKKRLGIRDSVARDLRTPKYRMRVVSDKKKKTNRNFCRKKT